MILKRRYSISLNRVRDDVRFREGDEALTLTVNADPMKLVRALNDAQKRMRAIGAESDDDEKRAAATAFASAIFGDDQAARLMDFYGGDPACVIAACGRYFKERLAKKITKAQKRA